MIKIMLAFRDCERYRLVKEQKARIAPGILITGEEYVKDVSKIIHAFSYSADDRKKKHHMKHSDRNPKLKPFLPLPKSSVLSNQEEEHELMILNDQNIPRDFNTIAFHTTRSDSFVRRKGKRLVSTISDDDVPTSSDMHGHSLKMKKRKKLDQQEEEDAKLLLSLSDRAFIKIR